MTKPGTAEPTREQFALAFRQLQRPHTWPATLDEALAKPHFATCLRRIAINLGRPKWQPKAVAPSLPTAPVPPTPSAPTPPPKNNGRGPDIGTWKKHGVDIKRRAANDHDD